VESVVVVVVVVVSAEVVVSLLLPQATNVPAMANITKNFFIARFEF
jgi:hypothetical protein